MHTYFTKLYAGSRYMVNVTYLFLRTIKLLVVYNALNEETLHAVSHKSMMAQKIVHKLLLFILIHKGKVVFHQL